jgi:hypothetical protein
MYTELVEFLFGGFRVSMIYYHGCQRRHDCICIVNHMIIIQEIDLP